MRLQADVFPLLEAQLCMAQQRALVYRTIRAMPLRLLERVMPWVVGARGARLGAGRQGWQREGWRRVGSWGRGAEVRVGL